MTASAAWTPEQAEIAARHRVGYATEADSVHGTNPVCDWCAAPWPCDVAILTGALAGGPASVPESFFDDLDRTTSGRELTTTADDDT